MKRALLLSAFALAILPVAAHAGARGDAAVERIVTLAPNLTELAFSAGAGERIVGTVEYADEPPQARRVPRIGDAFRVDLERLVALRPDVVLAWTSGTPAALVERIRGLGLRVESLQTNRIAHVAQALRRIGEIAGTQAVANEAAQRFEQQIGKLQAEYRDRQPIRVFVQVNEHPLYTVGGRQIVSEIVQLCGGENVFAHMREVAPAVGVEAVIAANPQVILVTDDVAPDPAALWRKWTHIEAVRTGNVHAVPADDISRATTRLSRGAQALCRTLDTARERLRAAAE